MANDTKNQGTDDNTDFAKQAESQRPGFLKELWIVMRYYKKWWLIPLILMLLLIGALVILSGTAAAPFIYTLF